MINEYSMSARFSATGERIARNAKEASEIATKNAKAVSKAIKQNIKDQLGFQNRTAEEVIANLIEIEGMDETTATKLVAGIQKKMGAKK